MSTSTNLLVAALLSAPAAVTQEPGDWRMPFRSPQANLVPPEDMWEHLQPMYEIAAKAPPEAKSFNQDGVEIVDDPNWSRHHEALLAIRHDAGYLSVVICESRHVVDRAIAFYGGFYNPDPALVHQLIAHLPGEPARALREAGYLRAVEYLSVHLPRKVPGDIEEWNAIRVGPGATKPPKPGDYALGLDVAPFVALLDLEDERDHLQALWFFARCTEIRPDVGKLVLHLGKDPLRAIVEDGSAAARVAAHEFVGMLDPSEDREVPAEDANAEVWVGWYDAVVHDVFPPIRRISEGLFDLYPSVDLDALQRVGKAGLTGGTLATDNVTGATKRGDPFRGCRIEALPEPLDLLGLEAGFTVIAINGVPMADQASILKFIELSAHRARSFLVEFVDRHGEGRAIEYRIR